MVRTVVVGDRPRELEELIARRRALGQDLFDEVWNGEYHMTPGPSVRHARVDRELARLLDPGRRRAGLVDTGIFNLGDNDNYRVPDGGLHRGRPVGVYVPTAAVVVEVLSPGDETYDKFPFYAEHGVDELIVADPEARIVQMWRLGDDAYTETDRSELLEVTAAELTREIDWP